jgi:hypothetical protein
LVLLTINETNALNLANRSRLTPDRIAEAGIMLAPLTPAPPLEEDGVD